MAKQPTTVSDYMVTMREEISKMLDTESFTKDQRSLAIQLALMIHSNILVLACGSHALKAQGKADQEKIVLMAFKVCTAVFEKTIEFGVAS